MVDGLFFDPKEASKGGFSAIEKFRGKLVKIDRVPSKFKNDDGSPAKDQAEVDYEDVTILRVAEGETEPELEEGKYRYWMPFAVPGKKAHANSFWTKGFLESCKKAYGTTPDRVLLMYVTLERVGATLY